MSEEKKGLGIGTAVNIGSQALGAIGGLIGSIGAGKRAKKQQDRQHNYNKETMEIQNKYLQENNRLNQELQLDTWNKTNAQAQAQHYRDAGLNVGLMYEGGGAGGATIGSQQGGAPSGVAGYSDAGIQAKGMDIMSNMGMQVAQIELMRAQTKKLEAEANKTAGVDTDLGNTQIESLTQGIKNQQAQKIATDIENDIKRLEWRIKDATAEDVTRSIVNNAEQTFYELSMMKRLDKFEEETYRTKVDTLMANYGLVVAQKYTTTTQGNLNNKIVQYYKDYVNIAQQNANANTSNAESNKRNANVNETNAVTNRINSKTNELGTSNTHSLETQRQSLQKELNDHNMLHDDVNLILDLPSKIIPFINLR